MDNLKLSVIGWTVVFAIVMLIIQPFAIIWALNVVFALSIPVTFETWLGVFILTAVIKTVIEKRKND